MTNDINLLGDITKQNPSLTMDGTFLSGVAALAQRILILLLTDKDVDPFGRGTRIPVLLGKGHVDIGALSGIFTIALGDVKSQLDGSYPEGTPEDEILTELKASLLREGSDWVRVTLSITTLAGDTLSVELPKSLTQIQQEAS
jgi:hypothetical protein